MRHSEGNFLGAGGKSIYFQCWHPEHNVRALVVIVHGAAEHGGRYQPFAEYFTERGYAVAALDQIGHGRSDGGRCCIRSFDEHQETLRLFQRRLEEGNPGLPMILLGHSMGGLIAANYLLAHQSQFQGCILSGPAIKTELQPPWYQFLLIRLFSALTPDLGVLQLDASGVSRDPAEVERYVNDSLNFTGKMTARMVSEMFRAMQNIQQRAGEIELPVLLLHGGEDSMTAPSGSQFLNDHVASADKTLKIYPGLYHEIFNEPERLDVFGDVERWLDARLPAMEPVTQ